MKLPLPFLLVLCLASSAFAFESVSGSASPDGRFHLVVEDPTDPDDMAHYRLATRDGIALPESFPSDYRHGAQPSVYWRPDGGYFVLQEPATRHQEGLFIAMRLGNNPRSFHYGSLPFNRGKLMDATGLAYAFAYVTFDKWLPHDQIALTIRGQWMGDPTTERPYECGFILDLKDGLRLVSFEIRHPTSAERAAAGK